MKLKTLLIVILALAVLAGGAYLLKRPGGTSASADNRVGEPLVAPALVERAARIDLSENGQTVRLRQSSPGAWINESYHDFPADFSKLSSLVGSLTSAKVERLVTQNPDRIARLEFKDTRVALADAADKPLVTLTLGKNADGGGRFVKFDDITKAYLSRVSVWLDATARNWTDTTLLTFSQDDIAGVTLTFPSGEPLTLTRTDKAAAFTTASTPAGQQVKASAVTSLLSNLASLRFTETNAPDAPEAIGAREHARTITLKTFDGKTHTVSIGRQPERVVVKPDATKPDPALPSTLAAEAAKPAPLATEPEKTGPAAVVGPLTDKVPAGPVFAFLTHSDASAPIHTLMKKRAFQVGEFIFTSLPADRASLFEPVPTPPSPPPAGTKP
jgi:hypothetical protein